MAGAYRSWGNGVKGYQVEEICSWQVLVDPEAWTLNGHQVEEDICSWQVPVDPGVWSLNGHQVEDALEGHPEGRG